MSPKPAPAAPPAEALLTCRQLVVGYNGRGILPPLDVQIRAGEFWSVLGRNGSGKTTWFKTVLGLIPPVSGECTLAPRLDIAYVAQRSAFDPIYPVSVRRVVAMGTERGASFLRPALRNASRVDKALEAVGALPLADRLFRDLSEGQKQRVLLARVVASEARLVLLDEPTAAMDAVAQREAMGLLTQLRSRFGMAVLMVSHHLDSAFRFSDQVLFFDPDCGEVVAGSPDSVLEHAAFHARYGDHALELRHGH